MLTSSPLRVMALALMKKQSLAKCCSKISRASSGVVAFARSIMR